MLKCPQCKDDDNLVIRHTVRCESSVSKAGSVFDYEVGDLEWSATDEAGCRDCGWVGTVGQMTVKPHRRK
jgi:hypothetical protein